MGRHARATSSHALIHKLHLAVGRMARGSSHRGGRPGPIVWHRGVSCSHGGRSIHVLDGCLACIFGPPSPTGHLRGMYGGRACSAGKCRMRMPCACTCGARAMGDSSRRKHLVPHWREQRRERRARKDAGDEGDGPRSHCVRTTAARTTGAGALCWQFRWCFAKQGANCDEAVHANGSRLVEKKRPVDLYTCRGTISESGMNQA